MQLLTEQQKPSKFNAALRFGVSPGSYSTYAPKDCPFETVFVDVTHRCNMACRNCYIPNRKIPDMDAAWLREILAQLPPGRYIRLVGAEPTVREDLPELVRSVRAAGHRAIVMTNGLKLQDRQYVAELKASGVQITYLSMNGAFDDALYKAIDGMRCAEPKRLAFENLRAEGMYTALGMIVVSSLNEHAVGELWQAAIAARNVREFHIRSVGAIGRYMKNPTLTLEDLQNTFLAASGLTATELSTRARTDNSVDFQVGRKRVQLTQWPELGSTTRGRLTPEGRIAPAFEHAVDNEGHY